MVSIGIILGSFAFGLGAEFLVPRRNPGFPDLRRRIANLVFWVINIVVAGFVFTSPAVFRNQLNVAFGLALPVWPLADGWSGLAAAFLLLDLLRYVVHRCQHAVPWLWRFHAVHHSDPHVDVTTAVRHHPIESLIAASVYWLAVLVLDIPAIVVAAHAVTVFVAAAVTHTNIRFPQWVERTLRPLLITIDVHLIHHSECYDEANSNFGAVLSIWDRLFGTFTPAPLGRVERLAFGVGGLPLEDCVKISGMLRMPWRLRYAAAAATGGRRDPLSRAA